LGKEHELGSLEIGKLADIGIITLNELENQPIYNPYSHLVYAINSHSVRDMIINGELVMVNRNLCKVDEDQLIQHAADYKDLILEEIKQ